MTREADLTATRSLSAPEPVRYRGLLAAVLVHALLIGGLYVMRPFRAFPPVPERAVEVEIVTRPPPVAPVPPKQNDRLPLAPPGPPRAPARAPPDAMVEAKTMLSAAALADPRSREARRKLATLAPAERAEQLCGSEAMAQIPVWDPSYRPQQVLSYSFGEPERQGALMRAEGAAFHSNGQWYRLSWHCTLSDAGDRVIAFAFRVGMRVPARDWQDYGLIAGDVHD